MPSPLHKALKALSPVTQTLPDRRGRVLAILILLVGATFSLTGSWFVHSELEKHRIKEFEWVAHNRNSALRKGIESGLEAVRTLSDIFAFGPGPMTREMFHQHAANQLQRHPGIHALVWAPRVERHGREAHEQRARTDYPDYRIVEMGGSGGLVPAAERARFFPSLFVEPAGIHEEIMGFDHASLPEQAALLRFAAESGRLAVSGRIPLISSGNAAFGFMAVMPVFRNAGAQRPAATGEGAPEGFVIGLFRIAQLANHAISLLEPRGVEFLIRDETAAENEKFLDFYASRLSPPSPGGGRWPGWQLPGAIKITESFPVAGRSWSITCSPTRSFRSAITFREGPWITLFGGVFLTVLFMLHIIQTRASIRLRDDMAQEIQESEQKLRILFNQSPDLIMNVDEEGYILLSNRTPQEGSPCRENLEACSVAVLPETYHDWYRNALRRVFETGEMAHTQYSRTDASWWEIRIVPLRVDGFVSSAMVIATDITEQRILEAQAIRNARLASLGVLAASVAHEINNPNNAIQFNTAILQRAWPEISAMLRRFREAFGPCAIGGVPAEQAVESLPRMMEGIARSSRRIQGIVGNLKHLARNDPGDMNAIVEMEEVLLATVTILQNQINRHTDHFSYHIPSPLPRVRGNGQQLEQVFINLVLNALQSLPDRCGQVALTVEPAREGRLLVRVADDGCGIPPDKLQRVFDPFYTTKDSASGTGLGLSICQRIVQNHGGTLTLRNRDSGGVEALVMLPVCEQPDQQVETP